MVIEMKLFYVYYQIPFGEFGVLNGLEPLMRPLNRHTVLARLLEPALETC